MRERLRCLKGPSTGRAKRSCGCLDSNRVARLRERRGIGSILRHRRRHQVIRHRSSHRTSRPGASPASTDPPNLDDVEKVLGESDRPPSRRPGRSPVVAPQHKVTVTLYPSGRLKVGDRWISGTVGLRTNKLPDNPGATVEISGEFTDSLPPTNSWQVAWHPYGTVNGEPLPWYLPSRLTMQQLEQVQRCRVRRTPLPEKLAIAVRDAAISGVDTAFDYISIRGAEVWAHAEAKGAGEGRDTQCDCIRLPQRSTPRRNAKAGDPLSLWLWYGSPVAAVMCDSSGDGELWIVGIALTAAAVASHIPAFEISKRNGAVMLGIHAVIVGLAILAFRQEWRWVVAGLYLAGGAAVWWVGTRFCWKGVPAESGNGT